MIMPFRHFFQILTAFVTLAALWSCNPNGRYITITGYAQGGEYMVKLRIDNVEGQAAKKPELLKTGIDSILVAIDNSLSGYNPSSLLTRFNAGETIVPDSLFVEMYRLSRTFYELTDGAFDVAAGPIFDAWGFGFKDGDLPSEEEIAEIAAQCGMGRLRSDIREAITEEGTLNPADLLIGQTEYGKTTSNKNAGNGKTTGNKNAGNGKPTRTQTVTDGKTANLPQLNFNAIAQGYSCDLVAAWLRRQGVTDMLIMLGGGEIYCEGLNPSGMNWIIGIDEPIDGNNVSGASLQGKMVAGGCCGIATSGNYRKFYIRDGKKYAHTIDPRTGRPVEHNLLSATILAEDATTADALATYCMVMGLEASIDFISANEGVEGYLIYDDTAENSEAAHSETANSGTSISETASSETANSGTSISEAAKSGTSISETASSETANSGTSISEAANGKNPNPGTSTAEQNKTSKSHFDFWKSAEFDIGIKTDAKR